MRIGLGIGIGFVRGRGMNAATFALSDAQWTLTERPEDANNRQMQDDVFAAPPFGYRYLGYRGQNVTGTPTFGTYAALTDLGSGHWRFQFSGKSPLGGYDYTRIFIVPVGVADPVAWNDSNVRAVSAVRTFIPSGLPFAPTFTYFADGSGTAAQLRLDPRAVNEGNGRNGVTPWRAVDQLRWRIGAGAYTAISDASTIDLTGLSASQSVGVSAHNVNGWGPETYVTVNAVLPALAAGDWTLVDAGDGANLIATVTNAPVSPTGAAPTGYEYTLNAGTTWTALAGGGAIPGAVGSNTCALRVVYDVGRSASSPSKTVSVAALSAFPAQRSQGQNTSGTGTARTITLPTHAIGDWITVFVSVDGGSTLSASGTWRCTRASTTALDPSLYIVDKQATSSSETLTVTSSASEAICWNISVDQGVSGIEFGSTQEYYGGTSQPADAPAYTLTGGSQKAKWLVAIATSGATPQNTTPPSGFAMIGTANTTGTTSGDVGLALAVQDLEAATLNPAAWPTNTRFYTTQMIALLPVIGASAVAPSGASLTISPESPVDGDTVTYTFAFAAGTTPITTSLTVGGTTTTNSTGVHARVHAAGSYPYSYTSSNAAGAGPSGSGTLVVAAAATVSASVSLSPSSPSAGQTVTATVAYSPAEATASLIVSNGGASVAVTQTALDTFTFTAPASGTTTVTPRATYGATVVSGTAVTFNTGTVSPTAVAPQLWGVPEVGDTLELLAGSGIASPSYLIERTDNGGTTYATEKTAVAGELFTVPATTGRQYRAVMLDGATRYVGSWTLAVVAAGPQIQATSADGRTLSVQTPLGTGTVRARPYGGGTAITAAVSGTTTTLTLTGNGAWQIDYASDGVTYGALAYRWCYTVGAISYMGRNCASVAMSAGVAEGVVVVVPISGRQATLEPPTPIYNLEMRTVASFGGEVVPIHTNGVMKNFTAPRSYDVMGQAAWDSRIIWDSSPYYVSVRHPVIGNTTQPFDANGEDYRQSFNVDNLCTKWPQMLAVNDGFTKAVSNPDAMYAGIKERHRHGLLAQFGGLAVASVQPSASEFAQQLTRHPAWVGGNVSVPNLASMISTLQGMSLSTSGMTVPDTAAILANLKRFNPALATYRGGANNVDSHERMTTYRNGWPLNTGSNYYQYQLINVALFLLTTGAVNSAWKAEMLTALAFWGHQIDVPGQQAQTQAGISQHHEALVMLSRIAKGLSFTDLPSTQPGNSLCSYSKFTAADLPRLQPHNNALWPFFSRRSQALAVTSSGTNYLINIKRNATYDGTRQYFQGLMLVRESTGEKVQITKSRTGSGAGASAYFQVTVAQSGFSTTPAVGEIFYMEPPAGAASTAIFSDGYCDWDNNKINEKKQSAYHPSPGITAGQQPDGYRTINEPHGLLWIAHALSAWPSGIDNFDAVKTYTKNTYLTGYPGTGLMDMAFTAVGPFIPQMWAAHAATLGLAA